MQLSKLLALSAVGAANAAWTDICTTVNNCPTIMMGISCQSSLMCAIVGGFSNTPMSVYYSIDQFLTFTKAQMIEDSAMLLDIALDGAGNGATAGLGLLGTGLLYTNDILSWIGSTQFDFLTGQDMNSMGNGQFGWVGQDSSKNTQGVLISQNKGASWTPANWPSNLNSLTEIRYGSFPNATTFYVSGGNWPSNNSPTPNPNGARDNCYPLTHEHCVESSAKKQNAIKHARLGNYSSYFGIMTKSTDAGKTWTQQFTTNNFYFNDVHCFDTTHCAAVGEGFDDGSPAPGGYVMMTTDGTNWKQVFKSTTNGASLMRVHMVSATEIWAAGGDANGGTFYHSTDGGKSFQMDGPDVPLVGTVMGLHFVDKNLGFAVGVTTLQSSVMIKWDGK